MSAREILDSLYKVEEKQGEERKPSFPQAVDVVIKAINTQNGFKMDGFTEGEEVAEAAEDGDLVIDDNVSDEIEEGEATTIAGEIAELEPTEDEEFVTKQNMKSTLENMIEQEAKMAFDKIEEI